MSHFNTYVITKNKPTELDITDILEPYSENNPVEPYIRQTKEEAIAEKKKEIKDAMEAKKDWSDDEEQRKRQEEYYNEYIKPLEKAYADNDEEALYRDAIKYVEEENIDEDGNILSTYNPMSKWDWWMIGGRWGGELAGENQIQKKDFPHIDLNKPEEKLAEEYPEKYQCWKDLISGKSDTFYKLEYLQERYNTFKSYLEDTVIPVAWAVVDEYGTWSENGEMGWFGMSTATSEDEKSWCQNFYDRFIKDLPEDYWITLVDCHI